MTDAVYQSDRSKGASGLRKVVFSKADLLAAKQVLERIREASEYYGIHFPEDIWAHLDVESAEHTVSSERPALVEKARRALFNRRHRARVFNRGMFGEPAWEMLLVLYVVDQGGRRHTISSLTEVTGVAQTTALRWLEFLEGDGLIHRSDHPTDRRAIFIELTDEARDALDLYFCGTR